MVISIGLVSSSGWMVRVGSSAFEGLGMRRASISVLPGSIFVVGEG